MVSILTVSVKVIPRRLELHSLSSHRVFTPLSLIITIGMGGPATSIRETPELDEADSTELDSEEIRTIILIVVPIPRIPWPATTD